MSYVGNKPAQTTIPADDSVTTAMVQDDAVTADKVANAINTSIAANTAKVTNATHTGDVTGATALTIAADAVDIAMLSATGTASSSTFLRGDNAWAAAGGDNTPAFSAYVGSTQTLSHDTDAVLALTEEYFDTDSAFNNTASGNAYSFTVPTGEGGKYFFHGTAYFSAAANSQSDVTSVSLRINGTNQSYSIIDNTANYGDTYSVPLVDILTLSAGDYIQFAIYGTRAAGSGSFNILGNQGSDKHYSWFQGFKLIGV